MKQMLVSEEVLKQILDALSAMECAYKHEKLEPPEYINKTITAIRTSLVAQVPETTVVTLCVNRDNDKIVMTYKEQEVAFNLPDGEYKLYTVSQPVPAQESLKPASEADMAVYRGMAARYFKDTAPQTPTWVDVAWRAAVANAVYSQVRLEFAGNLGPWNTLDADEQQRIVDAIKPFMPAPHPTPPVQELIGCLISDCDGSLDLIDGTDIYRCRECGGTYSSSVVNTSLKKDQKPLVKLESPAGDEGPDHLHEHEGNTCKQCGSELRRDGYCTDQTCIYSDWPQVVTRQDLHAFSIEEIQDMYCLKKRQKP